MTYPGQKRTEPSRTRESAKLSNRRLDVLALRWLLVAALVAVLFLLTVCLLSALITPYHSHHRKEKTKPAPVVDKFFACPVTTGSIPNKVKRIPITGSLASCVPSLAYSDQLISYNICCFQGWDMVCATSFRSAISNVSLSGLLRWAPEEQLLLLVTDTLLEANCWLSGHIFRAEAPLGS